MSEWREKKLSDVVFLHKDSFKPDKESSLNYIGLEHIGQGSLRIESVGNSATVQSNKYYFIKGDVLFGKLRPYFRKVAKAPFDGVCSTDIWVCRAMKGNSQDYIFYFLANQEFVDIANSTDEGTRMPRADWSFLKDTKWMFPPLPEQKAIAEVLSSLDDKIDLLSRQNKTLEALASTYFRQWFIEKASDDWEEKQLNKLGKIVCGKTPSTKVTQYFGGNIPFIKIPDMHNKVYVFDANETLSEFGARSQANKTVPPFSINVSCIATVGLVTMNVYPSQTNQQINTIIPFENATRYFLFLFLKSYYEELQALGSGGTMTLNINTTLFGEITLAIPPNNLLKKFNDIVAPLFEKIHGNAKQINTLKKLRDTLLPKLISGEVRVTV